MLLLPQSETWCRHHRDCKLHLLHLPVLLVSVVDWRHSHETSCVQVSRQPRDADRLTAGRVQRPFNLHEHLHVLVLLSAGEEIQDEARS